MPTPRNPAGFTLIELMIVIGVLAILSGMAMPILGMARHTARVSETRSLMAKADAAIRQFKGEVGIWPYQSHDPTKSFPEAGNRLAWHLGHILTNAESATLGVDLAAVTTAYDSGTHKPVPSDTFHIDLATDWGQSAPKICMYLADSGKLRARIAVMSGNSGVKGIAKDRATAVLSAPKTGWDATADDHPGWGDDYLAGEIPAKRIAGHSLNDAWGQPLVYVSPVVPGVRLSADDQKRNVVSEGQYGLGATGRSATISLSSDARTTAVASFALGYELSSMGRDMQTSAMRNEAPARDDILTGPYRKELQ
jgi:prepilin-type N-terminal cleavage/methylation domain-containing protein